MSKFSAATSACRLRTLRWGRSLVCYRPLARKLGGCGNFARIRSYHSLVESQRVALVTAEAADRLDGQLMDA